MSEEQTQEQNAQPAPANTDAGDNSGTISLIEKADSVAKRMEEANRKSEELLRRQEEILSRQLLSGRAMAGQTQKSPELTQAESDAEEAKKAVARFY